MPYTARKHFNDDIGRAWSLHRQATDPRDDALLTTDIARSAIVFGVGALDAYLCDAFVDLLARTLKHCRDTGTLVPSGYGKLAMPVGPMMAEYQARENWGLRMSARLLMEKDNMLQLGRLKELLNPALATNHKLWRDITDDYIALNRKRLTQIRQAEYGGLKGDARNKARDKATARLLDHMKGIVQRRHDIVHNCDRPKSAKQSLTLPAVKKMLSDIESFVGILDNHLDVHRLY